MLNDLLSAAVDQDERLGCRRVDRTLGIQSMPDGYALMLNPDCSHFYWLRHDGAESAQHWSKWAVYRWAKNDAADNA